MTFYEGYGFYYGYDDPTPEDLQRLAEERRAYDQAHRLEMSHDRFVQDEELPASRHESRNPRRGDSQTSRTSVREKTGAAPRTG